MTAMSSLLDPSFVRELEALRRRLDTRTRSGGVGEKVSRNKGASVEFAEHRAYAPGDDLRRIDWAAYARSGEPVLKVFRADEDVVVRLVCDASASMRVGVPSKLEAARRLAAAIGYMALARGERAQLIVTTDQVSPWQSPSRGRSGLAGLLRALGDVEGGGKTDLASAIESVTKRSSRPGMLVVLSDFFDPGPVLPSLARASSAGHDVRLVHVLAKEDEEPALQGDLTLEDAETGEVVDVTIDASALEAYASNLRGLIESLRAHARRHGATYVRARSDAAIEPVVRRFVAGPNAVGEGPD